MPIVRYFPSIRASSVSDSTRNGSSTILWPTLSSSTSSFANWISESCITLWEQISALATDASTYMNDYNQGFQHFQAVLLVHKMTSWTPLSGNPQWYIKMDLLLILWRSFTSTPRILTPYLAQRKVLYIRPPRMSLSTFLYIAFNGPIFVSYLAPATIARNGFFGFRISRTWVSSFCTG